MCSNFYMWNSLFSELGGVKVNLQEEWHKGLNAATLIFFADVFMIVVWLWLIPALNSLVVHFYQVDVLKDLNVSRSLNFHFDSVIPASLAGVFLHLMFLPSWYVNPACSLQKLKCVQ